jgi:hypothetical protein
MTIDTLCIVLQFTLRLSCYVLRKDDNRQAKWPGTCGNDEGISNETTFERICWRGVLVTVAQAARRQLAG